MITVHHLNQSRSQRILWMLEELHLDWRLVTYQRAADMQAPAALQKIHPLGKSPVLEDNGHILAESGAILAYLQETYDSGQQLRPTAPSERLQYRFWMHYAEGSLMPLLTIKLVLSLLGRAPVPWVLRPAGKALAGGVYKSWLGPQLATHSQFIEHHLAQHPWFAGGAFSAADIQMSFPVAALLSRGAGGNLPHLQAWWRKARQRPAWQSAVERGGPFSIPGSPE